MTTGPHEDPYPPPRHLSCKPRASTSRPVRQMSNMQRNKQSKPKSSDDEDSSEDSEDEDEDEELPDLETATLKHSGCVNRVRVRARCAVGVAASLGTWV